MNSKLSIITVLVVLLVLLSGCEIYNEKASQEQDASAKQFKHEDNRSVIYVYRENSAVAIIQAFRLYLNDQSVANSTSGTFVRLVVNPGIYKIGVGNVSNSSIIDSIDITADKGKIYYVKLTIGANVVSGEPKLSLVDEEAGQKDILSCSLLVSDS